MFSMGVLLFALISVNLISSGVKLEGFEEGAGDIKAECQKKISKFTDFDKEVKQLHGSNTLYKGNSVDYSKLTKFGVSDAKAVGGACAGYIASKYPPPKSAPVAASRPAPAPAPRPAPAPAPRPAPAPAPPARPAARRR